MWTITAKKLFHLIFISLITMNLIIIFPTNKIQIYPRILDEDQFQSWLEKKQKLNKNIARVCSKYGDYIDKISGRVLDRKMFLHYDKMVNCLIQKVLNKKYVKKYFKLFRLLPRLGLQNLND